MKKEENTHIKMIKAFNAAAQICTSPYTDAVADEHDAAWLIDCATEPLRVQLYALKFKI